MSSDAWDGPWCSGQLFTTTGSLELLVVVLVVLLVMPRAGAQCRFGSLDDGCIGAQHPGRCPRLLWVHGWR